MRNVPFGPIEEHTRVLAGASQPDLLPISPQSIFQRADVPAGMWGASIPAERQVLAWHLVQSRQHHL